MTWSDSINCHKPLLHLAAKLNTSWCNGKSFSLRCLQGCSASLCMNTTFYKDFYQHQVAAIRNTAANKQVRWPSTSSCNILFVSDRPTFSMNQPVSANQTFSHRCCSVEKIVELLNIDRAKYSLSTHKIVLSLFLYHNFDCT